MKGSDFMDFVRKVINGTELKDIVEIPDSLINRKLEILIFPVEEPKTKNKKKKSIAGYLSKYANPNLIEREENVWIEEAKE